MSKAVNEMIKNKGGICAVDDTETVLLALPIAGIISNLTIIEVAYKYEALEKESGRNGIHIKINIYDSFVHGIASYS